MNHFGLTKRPNPTYKQYFTFGELQKLLIEYEKAINNTHSCGELKVLDSDNFEDWIIVNGYVVFDDYYLKNDITLSESDLIDIYNKEVKK